MLSTQDLLQLSLHLCRGGVLLYLLLLRLSWLRLEILSQVVVEAALVPCDLDGKELDLDGDASVLFAVVAAAVQTKEAAKTVVFQVLPALTKFTPLCLGFHCPC